MTLLSFIYDWSPGLSHLYDGQVHRLSGANSRAPRHWQQSISSRKICGRWKKALGGCLWCPPKATEDDDERVFFDKSHSIRFIEPIIEAEAWPYLPTTLDDFTPPSDVQRESNMVVFMTLNGMLRRHPPDLILWSIDPAAGIIFESHPSTELSLTGNTGYRLLIWG